MVDGVCVGEARVAIMRLT